MLTRRAARGLAAAAAIVAGGVAAADPAPPSARDAGAVSRAQAQAQRMRIAFAHARAEFQAINAREAALSARVAQNRTALVRLLGALELWRRDPPPALVVHPRRAVDAARAALLMQAAAPELERRAAALAVEVRELNRVRRAAAQADAALFAAESATAETRSALDELASPRSAGLNGAQDPFAGVTATAAPAPPPDRLTPPAPGPPTRGYGDVWPGRGRAEGVAWAPPPSTPVVSPATARVEYAGPLKGFELVVILRLAGDWRVVLAGLQTVTAAPGAQVAAGEVIGRMAPPPARAPRRGPPSKPPELYLELRRGGRPVDPTALLHLRPANRRARKKAAG